MELESSDLWKLIAENGWDKGSKILSDPEGTFAQRLVHQLLLMENEKTEAASLPDPPLNAPLAMKKPQRSRQIPSLRLCMMRP